jgi:hypothetical protein
VTVVETITVYALIPLGIYGVIALLTLWPKFTRGPRYRPGQPWEYPPLWWSANPAGVGAPGALPRAGQGAEWAEEGTAAKPADTARGGASGSW